MEEILRAAFLGRAIHNSPEAWQEQVQSILAENEPKINTE
jgi:hypothetical protein